MKGQSREVLPAGLTLTLLPQTLAVCRLEPDASLPVWAPQGAFFSLTRTADELSLVADQEHVPDDALCERDWKALKVEGPLDFAPTLLPHPQYGLFLGSLLPIRYGVRRHRRVPYMCQ